MTRIPARRRVVPSDMGAQVQAVQKLQADAEFAQVQAQVMGGLAAKAGGQRLQQGGP
ncbi:MAG: hypothetical protein ACR2PL_25325 [Dehalococcoidia bacterium]